MNYLSKIVIGILVSLLSVPALAKPVLNKPIYNPETKTYFELIDASYVYNGQGPNWKEAKEIAEKRYYNNVQGRLAKIPSAQVEMFIRLNLMPNLNTWFGLYYDCGKKNLVWIDGTPMKASSYTNWGNVNWYLGHPGMFCHSSVGSRMPVFLALAETERKWAIQLPAKRWHMLVVEYAADNAKKSDTTAAADEAATTVSNPNSASNLPPTAPTQTPATDKKGASTEAAKPAQPVDLSAKQIPAGTGLPRYNKAMNP